MTQENLLLSQEDLQMLVKSLLEGATVAQVNGISADTLENLYALAYGLYNAGNYKDAETLFAALTVYDAKQYRFWMGLAGARQALSLYQPAIDAYQMAAVATELKNPEPLFYAAKCLIRLNQKEEALAALEGLLFMADKANPDYKPTLDKAQALLELLKSGDKK